MKEKSCLLAPIIVIIFFVSVLPFGAMGGTATPSVTDDLPGVDLTIQGLGQLVEAIACWILQIILAIMVVALVAAGIRFFLARGKPDAVTTAKKNLTWVLVGIAVVLATNIIISTIAYFLGDTDFNALPLGCSSTPADVTNPGIIP